MPVLLNRRHERQVPAGTRYTGPGGTASVRLLLTQPLAPLFALGLCGAVAGATASQRLAWMTLGILAGYALTGST